MGAMLELRWVGCVGVGWGNNVNDKIERRDRNVLAVHSLNKQPGFESVLKALALTRFRQLAMKSCRSPVLACKEAPWEG